MINWEEERKKIIGLGENSFKKSYYPALQSKIDELEVSSQNLQKILNSISDAIIIHDYSGQILYFNNQAYKIFNIPMDALSHYSISDISSKEMDVDSLLHIWNQVEVDSGKTFEWTVIQQETEKEFIVQVALNPIQWNGTSALIAVVRDFTERKQTELLLLEKATEIESQNEELKQLNSQLVYAKEKAEESDRLKIAFLANISHEIRTPLNGILGFSQLLSSDDTTREEQSEYVDIIGSCGVQLMTIIDDIIDISRIEANQMKIEKMAVNINDLLSQLELLFREKLTKSGVVLSCVKAFEDDKSVILSDPARLSQILINLIGNAIKFTRTGHIQFGYQFKKNKIVFFVEDTGIGIDKEKQSFIFNRFAQVETEFSKMQGGTGLGLSISKALVELLGGDIWVDSILGQGSTFYFSIPYMPITPKIIVEEESTKNVITGENYKAQKTILIAEDEFYNYLYLSKLLKSQQFEILHAKNGIEAVDFVRENPTINLVLMDLKMPLMDGIKATAEIKKLNKSLPVIAQTAYAQEGDRELAISSGFDDYIAKPYKNEALVNIVRKYIGD